MTEVMGKSPVKRVQIQATVIRADGTREELGVISDSNFRWRWFHRFFANRRIARANRNVDD